MYDFPKITWKLCSILTDVLTWPPLDLGVHRLLRLQLCDRRLLLQRQPRPLPLPAPPPLHSKTAVLAPRWGIVCCFRQPPLYRTDSNAFSVLFSRMYLGSPSFLTVSSVALFHVQCCVRRSEQLCGHISENHYPAPEPAATGAAAGQAGCRCCGRGAGVQKGTRWEFASLLASFLL